MPRKQHKDPDVEYILHALDAGMERAHPNPQRIGCPTPAILKKLALHEVPVQEIDGWVKHFSSCGPCLEDIRQLQNTQKQKRNKILIALGAAASITIVSVALWIKVLPAAKNNAVILPPPAPSAVTAVLNVEVQQTRGGESITKVPGSDLQHLPRHRVALAIYLPLGSEAGHYEIRILRAVGDTVPVLAFDGSARIDNGLSVLNVEADLSTIPGGTYTIGVKRDGDEWRYSKFVLS